MDRSDRINLLFEKYLAQQCTAREIEELVALLQQAEAENALTDQMKKIWDDIRFDKTEYEVDWSKIYDSVINNQQQADKLLSRATAKTKMRKYLIIGVILLTVIATCFFLLRKISFFG